MLPKINQTDYENHVLFAWESVKSTENIDDLLLKTLDFQNSTKMLHFLAKNYPKNEAVIYMLEQLGFNKKFEGIRKKNLPYVTFDEEPLALRSDLINHSMALEWGYNGSGPKQLALAILVTAYIDDDALEFHEQFSEDIISSLNEKKWSMTVYDVHKWVYNHHIEELKTENIVKRTCKELGLTYKELGEAIGYGESSINNASRSDKVSEPMQKAINLYIKTIEQEKELKTLSNLKDILRNLTK